MIFEPSVEYGIPAKLKTVLQNQSEQCDQLIVQNAFYSKLQISNIVKSLIRQKLDTSTWRTETFLDDKINVLVNNYLLSMQTGQIYYREAKEVMKKIDGAIVNTCHDNVLNINMVYEIFDLFNRRNPKVDVQYKMINFLKQRTVNLDKIKTVGTFTKIPDSPRSVDFDKLLMEKTFAYYKGGENLNNELSEKDFIENGKLYEELLLKKIESLNLTDKFENEESQIKIIVSSDTLKEHVKERYQIHEEKIEIIKSRNSMYVMKLLKKNTRPVEITESLPEKPSNLPETVQLILNSPVGLDPVLINDIYTPIVQEPKYFNIQMQPKERYFIIGDLHADSLSLRAILEQIYSTGAPENTTLFFLGDYVDRGTNDLMILTYIFKLKLQYPEKIFLLKGNHEDYIAGEENIKPRFFPADFFETYYEGLKEMQLDKKIFIDILAGLPVFVKLRDLKGRVTLLVHGGLPQRYFLDKFETLESIVDNAPQMFKEGEIEKDISKSLYWNDPSRMDMNKTIDKTRGTFSKQDYEYAAGKYNLYRIVRGHENGAKGLGYKIDFQDGENEVITIFSTGNNSSETGYHDVNNACYAEILSNGKIIINKITQ